MEQLESVARELNSDQTPAQKRLEEEANGGGGSYEFVQRDLTPEETRGVWTLVGILVGGWVLGGVLKPRSRKDKIVVEEVAVKA